MATVPGVNTWAAGSILTAAQLNTYVSNAVTFLLNRPICQVRQTLAQAVANITATPLLFDGEDVDNDGMHSTTTNTDRITAQTAGRYVLGGGDSFASNATGERAAIWNLNGSGAAGGEASVQAVNGDDTRVPARSISLFLNVGDYVQLVAYQSSTVSRNTVVSPAGEQPLALVRWVGTT